MAEEQPVRKDLLEKIAQVGPCEILIGIPSYNNSGTIGRVVDSVREGLDKSFHGIKAVLVNADGGSMDGTPRIVTDAVAALNCIQAFHRVNPRHKLTAPYHGIPGKGNAIRMILEVSAALKVKTCAVVGADLLNIGPDWIERLISPVRTAGYEFVLPFYLRHKYDGTLTNFIIYPLARALYGKRIRQPLGPEFACSGEMVDYFIAQKNWEADPVQYGVDFWLTATAARRGGRFCQTYLGDSARAHKDTGPDLSTMLTQVVGSLFSLMQDHAAFWSGIGGSEAVPMIGDLPRGESMAIRVNLERMLHAFHLGVTEFRPLWNGVLSGETLEGLSSVARSARPAFRFPDRLWVRVLYDFALAAHRKMMNPEHLLRSLTPLYLGKTVSFILETQESSREAVEDRIELLCREFEEQKAYLVERWGQAVSPSGK